MREKLQAVIDKLAGVEAALGALVLEAQRTGAESDFLYHVTEARRLAGMQRQVFEHLAEVIEPIMAQRTVARVDIPGMERSE